MGVAFGGRSVPGVNLDDSPFAYASAAASEPTEKLKKFRLANRKILVVEDAIDNQILVMRFLELAGADVECASDGIEGVEKAQMGDFDVILMDVQMPEMGGYEAAEVLREQGYWRPIIALTAHSGRTERLRSLEAGCNGHATKPIHFAALVDLVAAHCENPYLHETV